MKIQLESTDEITVMEGRPVRLWRGTTESGTKCYVFVASIAAKEGEDAEALEKELIEISAPGSLRSRPLRNILPLVAIFIAIMTSQSYAASLPIDLQDPQGYTLDGSIVYDPQTHTVSDGDLDLWHPANAYMWDLTVDDGYYDGVSLQLSGVGCLFEWCPPTKWFIFDDGHLTTESYPVTPKHTFPSGHSENLLFYTPVPEPTGLVLAVISAIALFITRRRR